MQGWARPEVAPIPAADHRPIICNYLHLYTSEIKKKEKKGRDGGHTHAHTLHYTLKGYDNRTIDRPRTSEFEMNAPNYVTLMRKLYLL